MRKWILLLLALVMMVNLSVMVIGCGGEKKAEQKPAAKEEAKPAEAPAPPAPAATPAPAAPEATKK
jgi:hypothetical protein